MLFWALLASGQITMRKVDGWQSLGQPPANSRLTSPPDPITFTKPDASSAIPTQLATAPRPACGLSPLMQDATHPAPSPPALHMLGRAIRSWRPLSRPGLGLLSLPSTALPAARPSPPPPRTPARRTPSSARSPRPAGSAAGRPPAGRPPSPGGAAGAARRSITFTSAFSPGASRPRSRSRMKSAVSLVMRFTTHSSGRRGPRARSRTQWVSMKVGIAASQMHAAMRAAVAEAEQRVRVGQHARARPRMVAGHVVDQREEQHPAAVAARPGSRSSILGGHARAAPPWRRGCAPPSARSPAGRRARTCGPSAWRIRADSGGSSSISRGEASSAEDRRAHRRVAQAGQALRRAAGGTARRSSARPERD